jgi:hypothetical protein
MKKSMNKLSWAGRALLLMGYAGSMAGAQISAAPATDVAVEIPAAIPVAIPAPGDLHPTLITLHMKGQTLATVVAEISRQSGASIEMNGPQGLRVTIDADQKPMLEVLNSAASQAHAVLQNSPAYYRSDGQDAAPHLQINFGPGQDGQLQVTAGPVMARFTGIEHLNQLTAPVEVRDFCDVQGSVLWEPRLSVAYYQAQSIPTVAVDENGLSLVPDGAVADPRQITAEKFRGPGSQNDPGGISQFSIGLKVPPSAGRRLVHLTGQIHMWVVDRSQTGTISDLQSAVKNRTTLSLPGGGIQLRVMGVWSSTSFVQVQLRPVQSGNSSADSSADSSQQQAAMLGAIKVRVLDAAGHRWGQFARLQQFGDANHPQMIVMAQGREGENIEPKKVELDVPVSVKEIDLPYDLRDLPLP